MAALKRLRDHLEKLKKDGAIAGYAACCGLWQDKDTKTRVLLKFPDELSLLVFSQLWESVSLQ